MWLCKSFSCGYIPSKITALYCKQISPLRIETDAAVDVAADAAADDDVAGRQFPELLELLSITAAELAPLPLRR